MDINVNKKHYTDDNKNIKSIDFIIKFNDIHNLVITDELLIYNDIPNNINSQICSSEATIIEIIDSYTININIASDLFKDVDNIFIYGKKINDFHNVNYNTLFVSAIGAIQALTNQVNELLSRIEKLEASNTSTN